MRVEALDEDPSRDPLDPLDPPDRFDAAPDTFEPTAENFVATGPALDVDLPATIDLDCPTMRDPLWMGIILDPLRKPDFEPWTPDLEAWTPDLDLRTGAARAVDGVAPTAR